MNKYRKKLEKVARIRALRLDVTDYDLLSELAKQHSLQIKKFIFICVYEQVFSHSNVYTQAQLDRISLASIRHQLPQFTVPPAAQDEEDSDP